MIDSPPRHIGDVQESVDPAKVDKGTIVGDILDHSFDHLAFDQIPHQFGPLFGPGFFHDRPPRDNNVAAPAIHLQNLERLRDVKQRRDVPNRPYVDLAARQKGHRTGQINRKATFYASEYGTFDPLFGLEGFFQMLPGFLAARPLTGQNCLAGGILDTINENLDLRADGNLFGLLLVAKFAQCDTAFGLQANIDNGVILFDRQDRAGDDSPFESLHLAHRFFEQDAELFTCWEFDLVFRHGEPSLNRPTGCLRRSSRNPS